MSYHFHGPFEAIHNQITHGNQQNLMRRPWPSTESPSAELPTPDQRLTEKDFVGLKYFDLLLPLFQRLHHDGCQRDKSGNRELHFDQFCLMVLVFLFNPICSSLRALQQAS